MLAHQLLDIHLLRMGMTLAPRILVVLSNIYIDLRIFQRHSDCALNNISDLPFVPRTVPL